MSKDRFSILPGTDEPRFSVSLADVCNGIDCISNGRFPAEVVIQMAGHMLLRHCPDEFNPEEALTAILVDESAHDDDDEPVGPIH